MKIQIDGTNIKNKGAELMLYCVLEQIERLHPEALVYWNDDSMMGNASSIATSLKFKKSGWQRIAQIVRPFKAQGILRRLNLPHEALTNLHAISDVDLVLDASGFHYSDQFKIQPKYVTAKRKYYRDLKNNKTKLIFLPQAFGPFETNEGKELAKLVVENGKLVFARDHVSFGYLVSASENSVNHVLEYPDITIMSSYEIPDKYKYLKGKVCIIPNKRMVDKGGLTFDAYLQFLIGILAVLEDRGEEVFLLNHEGAEDLQLCKDIQRASSSGVDVVSGLGARQIKGLISISRFVISSRFHGVASALSTSVPCLATSWSHKYEELFKTFNLSNRLLDVADIQASIKIINRSLEEENLRSTKRTLDLASKRLKDKNAEMWNLVWETSGLNANLS